MLEDDDTGRQLPEPMRVAAWRSFRRLFSWYAVVLSLFGGVWWLLSGLPPAPGSDPTSPLTGRGALLSPAEMLQQVGGAATSWTAALLQMLAALLLVIPLAVVYVRTRTHTKYDHTLVQTVIVLPVAITAVLMMVRGSLALAFGLAGVVGAVRFRSNLKESGDSVYIFAAVVIGFAAGIQALGIAALLSLLFAALELSMWYWNIADPSARQLRRLGLGEHEEVVTASLASPKPDSQSRDQILQVGVGDLANGQVSIAAVLMKGAKRSRFLERHFGVASGGSLKYAVRLRKDVDLQELTRRLRQGTGGTIHSLEWLASGENNGDQKAKENNGDQKANPTRA